MIVMRSSFILISIFIAYNLQTIDVLSQWEEWILTDGAYGGTVMAFASNGDTLFSGGENGVYMTTNLGESWEQRNNGLGHVPIFSLAAKNDIIFAGTMWSIYKSTDGGLNWFESNNGLVNGKLVSAVLFTNNFVFAGSGDGIYRSSDNGNNWIEVFNSGGYSVFDLEYNNNYIYASTENGVYLSVDDGINWLKVRENIDKWGASSIFINNGKVYATSYEHGIFVSIDNGYNWSKLTNFTSAAIHAIHVEGDTILVGTHYGGMFRSIDGGINWSSAVVGAEYARVLVFHKINNNIFAGELHGGGVYITQDFGDNWNVINNGLMQNVAIWDIEVGSDKIVAGAVRSAVHISINNGKSWRQSYKGCGVTNHIQCIALKDNRIIAGDGYYGINISDDNGNNWFGPDSGNFMYAEDLIIHNENIYAGSDNGVYLSTNNGAFWKKVGLDSIPVRCLVSKGDSILAGTWRDGIYLSINQGKNWTKFGLQDKRINKIIINGNNIFAGSESGMYLSKDNGQNWTLANQGIINEYIYSLASSGNNIFAGTGNGVYLTTNNGDKWSPVNLGLSKLGIHSLAINGDTIFAGSFGIFRSSVSKLVKMLDSVGLIRYDTVCKGESYTFDIKVEGANNRYQWFKDDIAIDSLRVDPKFTITSVSLSDTGTYYCHITNTLAKELTLYSRPIKLILLSLPNTRIMIDNGNFNDNALKIGGQVWQSKNLDVDHYRNGDSIPEVRDNSEWANLTTGAWCYYNNDPSLGPTYGKLYNFYAVADPRGLAPDGWHIPTDAECKELELFLGMTQSEVDYGGAMDGVFRGKMGGKLKSTGNTNDGDGLWLYPNLGATNETGFNLLPAGSRQPDAIFHDLAYGSAFWQTETWCRNLDYQERGISRYTQNRGPNGDYDKKCGLSVRCIKDIPEISDTIFICGGQEKKYFTFYQPGISSKWEIIGGTVIGSSTNDTITVNWDAANSGRIKLIRIPQNGGCEDSTERIVIYNPQPDPIIIGDSTACENEAIIYHCNAHPFSNYMWHIEGGNIIGKNDSSAITVAWLSPGIGRITLIQSNTSGCIDSIEFNVRVNQTPETPVITRIGDSLSSNHLLGNQWYFNGSIIDGAIQQVYFPAFEGNYTVVLTDSNGCKSKLSDPYNFTFNYQTVILEVVKSEGNPGDIIEIPINIQDKSNPVLSKVASLSGEIMFNATLLEPVGDTPIGVVDSSVRRIMFNTIYDNNQAEPVYKITLRAMLGNDSTTNINLENLLANDTTVKFKTIPGTFTLRGICREGGARLINSNGSTQLMTIKPNPAEDMCEIETDLIESGSTSIRLYSAMGSVVKTFFDKEATLGRQKISCDLSDVSSGSYYIILRTPTIKKITRLDIIK